MLLVCPGRSLSSFPVFERCERFAVSVLAEGQEAVSNTFAGFRGDRFAQVDWRADSHGVPLIEGAAARFSCAMHQRVEAGDHLVLLGRVDAFQQEEVGGLGYGGGGYFSLGLEREAAVAPARGQAVAGAIVEQGEAVLLEETETGWRPPQVAVAARAGLREAVLRQLSERGVAAEIGAVFSVFETGGGTHTYFRATASQGAPGAGRFVPVAEVPALPKVSPAIAAMLDRFLAERQSRAFGLYVGDEAAGDVHRFHPHSPAAEATP